MAFTAKAEARTRATLTRKSAPFASGWGRGNAFAQGEGGKVVFVVPWLDSKRLV